MWFRDLREQFRGSTQSFNGLGPFRAPLRPEVCVEPIAIPEF